LPSACGSNVKDGKALQGLQQGSENSHLAGLFVDVPENIHTGSRIKTKFVSVHLCWYKVMKEILYILGIF